MRRKPVRCTSRMFGAFVRSFMSGTHSIIPRAPPGKIAVWLPFCMFKIIFAFLTSIILHGEIIVTNPTLGTNFASDDMARVRLAKRSGLDAIQGKIINGQAPCGCKPTKQGRERDSATFAFGCGSTLSDLVFATVRRSAPSFFWIRLMPKRHGSNHDAVATMPRLAVDFTSTSKRSHVMFGTRRSQITKQSAHFNFRFANKAIVETAK
mmetsp:Transcript_13380/g.15346  ORF Transcript_13380/g.15346 Transcript_13380/m.15346 type:complete len:208 (-) Transcript_13380:10-633(-)